MKTFKQLSESLKDECGILYGKHLFDELFGGDEKDTDEEKDLINALEKYIRGSGGPEIIPLLHKLNTCRTIFNNELIPHSDNNKMYRYVSLAQGHYTLKHTSIFKHHIPNMNIKVVRPGKEWIISGHDYQNLNMLENMDGMWLGWNDVYKPQGEIESWSDSPYSDFYGTNTESWNMILWECPMKHDEFIFDSQFLEKVRGHMSSTYMGEDEVIRITDKKIKGIVWVNLEETPEFLLELRTTIKKHDKEYTMGGVDVVYLDKFGKGDIYISTEPRRDDL